MPERSIATIVDQPEGSAPSASVAYTLAFAATVVNQAVEAAGTLYTAMNHELTVSLPARPVYLNADPARLAQVIGNHLHNAGKFTWTTTP